MAPSIESVVSLCHKATVLGNKISIHMLEYVGTVEKHGHQFDELAHDFLETCRIIWSLEAGLTEYSRSNQRFPPEMVIELDKKFKTANSDFQVLDHMLSRLLEYEKKGTMGKIQKGWRKMFADNDVERMRENLAKTREALRMSSLVFQWSLGDAKIDESVGIGYTGLAAALDRMSRGKTVAGITKLKSLSNHTVITHQVDEVPAVWPLPPLPVTHNKTSVTDHSSLRTREESHNSHHSHHSHNQGVQLLPEIHREPSISNYTIGSGASSRGARERVTSTVDTVDRSITHSTGASGGITEVDTLVGEMDSFEPYKVIRLKAEPLTMPRWSPRNTVGADTPALREALLSAVESGNHKLVEQLLDRGVSPDSGSDAHILNHAISRHDPETVRILLLFGADPNTPDNRNITPLFLAVEESFRDAVTMLLKYGADPNLSAGLDNETPFITSVLEDKFDLARIILTYGGDVNHVMTNGDTALMAAIIKKRSKRIVDMLLEYGADANVKNREGHTPLFEAIQSNRIDIVTSLLDHGANPNLPGPKHMVCLKDVLPSGIITNWLWPSAGLPRILELLLSRGADPKKAPGVMELATSINNIESVRVLLRAGVDPNAKKDGIYTPLCSSIRDNRADIFELLLASGADPNVPSAEYPAFKCVTHYRTQYLAPLVAAGADLNSPKGILETAVQCKNLEALYWLLDTGKVSPNDKAPKTGATPLTTAIRENRADLVDLLLSRGADPNVRGENWPVCMAVHQPHILKRLLPALAEPRAFKGVMEMAVVANQLESIKLLLKAGVSVEDRNGGVFSPLTTAIREDRKEIVHFLLEEAGADVNAPGEHLPIVKALRRLHGADTEIVELLLKHGADPNKIYRGHNAYIQAIENGDPNILRVLIDRAGVDFNAKDDSGMTIIEIAAHRGWEEGRQILLAAKATS
ncbi:ankyrin repeat-containing domain protein [Hypoxylon sp. FL1857]|nr:ankyrin repeat-containing domain protein [Hypoxylon sp. FL1857]